MDTRVFRYQTFSDLEVYTYGSAAVVGLMMCRVGWRKGRPTATPRASASPCSSPTSARRRRRLATRAVYLPLEDLERFGYTERD